MSDGWIALAAVGSGCMAAVHLRLSVVTWRKMKGQVDD